MPGGAFDLVEAGVLDGVSVDLRPALRPLPRRRHGRPARRAASPRPPTPSPCGSPAAAATPRRPHLTEDLTFALGKVITDVPAALTRRLDPRAGLDAGLGLRPRPASRRTSSPASARSAARSACSTRRPGARCATSSPRWSTTIVAPYGVHAEVDYVRGVPPVVNEPGAAAELAAAAASYGGPGAVGSTEQSLGGEDFSWYLQSVPGAMARLGHPYAGWPGLRPAPG